MADPYKDAPWQQGDILRADELNAMQMGLSPLGTIIPWALPFANAKGEYGNVDDLAPFHLPCTGGVYPTSRAPALSAAINGIYGGPLSLMSNHDPAHLNGVGVDHLGNPICTYDIGNTSGDQLDDGTKGFPTGMPDHTWIYCHSNVPGVGHEVQVYAKSGTGTATPKWNHLGDPPQEGQYVKGVHYPKLPNGQANVDGDGNQMIDSAVYEMTGGKWVKVPNIDDDGFIVPDLRGRSPIGAGGEGVAREWLLGERFGDKLTNYHRHDVRLTHYSSTRIYWSNSGSGAAGQTYAGPQYVNFDSGADYWTAFPFEDEDGDNRAMGFGLNYQPSTSVNFLIACGVSGSATPSTRSGEVHRLPAVTTDHMIRQRLADPNLSDEGREMLEANLAGEPWPPPVDEPPATRTTTTTRKAAKRKKS